MWSVVWTWIANNYPVLLLIAATAVIVWLIARFYYTRIVKAEDKIAIAEKKIESLPCLAQEKDSRAIMSSLSEIITYLKIKDSKFASLAFSRKESPRKLNESGTQLLADCEGVKFINDNREELIAAIDSKQPKTALDVESAANEVLIERINSSIFNPLKEWVYRSPSMKIEIQGEQRDYAVTISDVCFVISLPLRDEYLALHPDLK